MKTDYRVAVMIGDSLKLHYEVSGDDFLSAGMASSSVKNKLKQIGYPTSAIRKIAVAMYEAEINMVIHANGGVIDVDINSERIKVLLKDVGPGIPDIEKAMQKGYSTATDEIRELGFGAGMGLPNIKFYTDEMDIDTVVGKGTTITIVVYCKS